MTDVILQSTARGAWGYEIQEGQIKHRYEIVLGINSIPEDHMKVLKDDAGFKARVEKKVYKELKPREVKKIDQQDDRLQAKKQEMVEVKQAHKVEIEELTKNFDLKFKKQKTEFNAKIQQLTQLKAESEAKTKNLEADNIKLKGLLSDATTPKKAE